MLLFANDFNVHKSLSEELLQSN